MPQTLGWIGPWIALVSLSFWVASPGSPSLVFAALGMSVGVLGGVRERGVFWVSGSIILVIGILAGVLADREVSDLSANWNTFWAEREAEVGGRLQEELQAQLRSGEAAADHLVRGATEFERLEDVPTIQDIRAQHGVSALALYDSDGMLRIWDGMHRGKVPEEVQAGQDRHAYVDLPLFGYLYVTALAPDGGVAVAAQLMRTDLPLEIGARLGDFGSEFLDLTGEHIRINPGDTPNSERLSPLVLPNGERLLEVLIERPDAADRAEQILARWRWLVSSGLLIAWLLLAVGGAPNRSTSVVATGGLLFLLGLLPLQEVAGLERIFDWTLFALPLWPGSLKISLGRLVLLAIAGLTGFAVLPRPKFAVPIWVAALSSALLFPLVVAWVRSGLQPLSLASDRFEWIVYEMALGAILALTVASVLWLTRSGRSAHKSWTLVTVASAVLLGGMGGTLVLNGAFLPVGWIALWAIPTATAAVATTAWSDGQRPIVGWLLAIVIATTAAVPNALLDRVNARRMAGGLQLIEAAAVEDPDLEHGLVRLGSLADSLAGSGRGDVDVLYQAWRASGLAEELFALRLTMWDEEGENSQELRIGIDGDPSDDLAAIVREAQESGEFRILRPHRDDARYVMAVPLRSGQVLTAIAPPLPPEGARSPLASLVRGGLPSQTDPITLIPILSGDPLGSDSLSWHRTTSGWQGEMAIEFNNASYHAHIPISLPGSLLASARGSLLLVLNLLVFSAFWVLGRGLLLDVVPPEAKISGLVISFRARVTLALFGFFALASALFGTLAYRTLTQASSTSARVVAERVVEDAAGWYLSLDPGPGSRMERLATQVGAELLEYRNGELRGGGGVAELVELGLYEGWMPFTQNYLLDGREGVREFTETSLGRLTYVTAYRRLPDGDILGAQVPLSAGATAIQRMDLIELLGFVMLVGAALSLVLAWMAGRALTSPIRALQIASEAVGSGNLDLKLPGERGDEFGAVFRAFNRMVNRVRRARRQLVRTSRRTQAIMEEAAVGMVALDSDGRVTLANPIAENLFGSRVVVGQPVPRESPFAEALSMWITHFFKSSEGEANTEIQAGESRVRIRARRLGTTAGGRGVVVAMDDITDELHTERVLAWGEMARQVAHEVKNPLTPIKLSIQHIRRAREDRRTDFDDILVKNVDAILAEIERLAGIAQSFSKYGAPGGEGEVPLGQVHLHEIVDDVMALYGGGSSTTALFEQEIALGLPPVRARTSELKEVLINLLENARIAVTKGGIVRILGNQINGRVVLAIVDDGAGIPEELLPRIFEPQFSTRSTGAGLGLPIVKRIVESWGGTVEVDSATGGGTTVSVFLSLWTESLDTEVG
ncbi:MAG: ATP-binding protein [bacterium]|nr:HAMP domain-containing protein [Gemmatimonadota bacterium]HIL90942.1 HAMP domain-containing protein [Gemmatimonadota bacterium]